MVQKHQPTQQELERRRLVGVHAEHVSNISSTDFPGHFPGEDHKWSLEKFKQNFHVDFHRNEQFDAQFSLVGIDAAIANAFRRILIAELPTLAIEDVYIIKNTSIIQDEVLAHRLGLIPLKGNPEAIRNMTWYKKPESGESEEAAHTDYNTVVMELNVQCDWAPDARELAKKGETDPKKLFINSSVYASQINFVPTGRQTELFAGEGAIQPVHPDILIAKLRPGQSINLSMHCIKSIGADHAKFSPVATATYRLLPHIQILQPILGADAHKFARCFPAGVIAEETVTAAEAAQPGSPYAGHEGEKKAVVANPFNDTVTREVLRHDEFKDKVKLGRVRDHFIFSVESSGQFDSDDLFIQSVKALKVKCEIMKRNMANLMR
ncbi:dna-directed rna polymerase i and iii subunit [Diplodia corticola]|uniref:DNA-directed RNA polymerases I and III subunit RPAC1 n=1 Tax=Diplodia corticola TaxID=236234 RepID=A0A1J9RPI0_9PEZI|nr:dna-directed rna polymerase i and iii subunit [Diplodia corticola]OJD29477.1 dna-directed rna polymerase i and iii subunit [Diplodia corticola]